MKWFQLKFIQSQFTVGEHSLINGLIFLQRWVSTDKLQDLLNNIEHFVLNLVEYPLVIFSERKNSRVLQINEVAARFSLRKIKNAFQIRNTHFAIGKNQ